MVLESLLSPFKAEQRPSRLLFLGAFFCSVAIVLSLWIFKSQASLIMVFLTAMAALPLIYNTIKMEEEKDLQGMEEKWLLKEHAKALKAFVYLFIGATVMFAFWYVVLSSDTVTALFQTQTTTINAINSKVTGNLSFTGNMAFFSKVFLNNIKVLIFCILFSFVYGSGAIFILMWNASVIGTAIGNFVRTELAKAASMIGFDKIAHYFQVISMGLFRYSLHGIPEILAYFVGGLAGGIIGIAVIKHDFGTTKFEHILLDSADLLLLSLGILFVAALLEVFVTPIIF
ncbi:stage II sporulation protein M [Candidatus Woesearchaeota archaeon]|nr:stage II sporulation protein M [Candidatus Woesearchaeota archaeon]